jgi:hypothetical protein
MVTVLFKNILLFLFIMKASKYHIIKFVIDVGYREDVDDWDVKIKHR